MLIVDANESWTLETLTGTADAMFAAGVRMIEQPLPRGRDAALVTLAPGIPLGADESCQNLAELAALGNRYDIVNIKLDKCGGLTEALAMIDYCETHGIGAMVGNMLGSSLAMAAAFAIAGRCRYVDLDGPWFQTRDRDHPIEYRDGSIWPPDPALWGGG